MSAQQEKPAMAEGTITAALLVIGDEILSGRTKDKNIGYIAEYLTGLGIDLREVRVVPDVEGEIVGAINALRSRYAYLFTTGGIGPTHDDITADCVAKAFGVPIDVDPRAVEMLLQRIRREDLNEARLRMARIPQGADLIENPISRAPGFRIGNVIVMAGVPAIMQAMLDNVAPGLVRGEPVISETIEAHGLPEGLYAAGLGEIAQDFPSLSIGSYPSYAPSGFTNQIVARGRDRVALSEAAGRIRTLLDRLRAEQA
jgi:molybdenum cofactor synthesis domain-containing protein